MAADGKVVVEVILDDGKVAKGVANVDKSLGGLDRTAQKGVFTIGKLVAALGLVAAAKKGIDLVTSAIDGAIDRYDTLNNFPRVMQQIGFSAEDSQRAINRLADGVKGLPTTLDSVAKTAQRIAVMTGDLDGAVETTLALNNAFLASGASAADAQRGLEQYIQMLATGKVDLQSWRTLQETMGVALNDVAKAFGFAGKSAQMDLYQALKDGEITFDQFNKKIIELSNATGGFAERARTATGGIRTAVTNMRTAVVRGVTDIIAAIDKVLSKTRFKSIENLIVSMGDRFYSTLNRIANAIPKIYEALRPWTPLIYGVASAFGTLVVSMAIFGTIARLRAGFITLIGVIKGTTAATTGFQRAIAFLAKTPMLLVVSALAGLAVATVNAYKKFEPFRNAIDRMGSTLKTAFAPIIIQVGELFGKLRQRFDDFAKTKGANFLEKMAAAFEKVAMAAAKFVESKVVPFIEKLADTIGKAFSGDFSGVTNFFAQLVPTIVSVLLGGIPALVLTAAKFLPSIAEGITNNLPTILNAVTNVATSIIQAFATHFPMLIETGVQILENLIQGLSIAIPKVLPVVIVAITKILETAATLLPQFIDMGLQIFLNLIQGLTSALPQIVEVVLVIITTLLTTFVEHLPMIIETGTSILLALVEGVVQLLPVLVDTGLQLLLTIVETLIENLPMIIDAGIRILTSLIDGIGKIIPQLIPLALNIIITLAAALIKNLPKIIDAGIRILRALIEGVIKILPQLISLALRLIVELASALIRNLPKIIAAGVEILLKLISGIIKALPQLLKLGGKLVVDLAKAIGKKVPDMLGVGRDLVKGLIKGIREMTGKAIEAITGVVGGVINKAKSLLKIKSPSRVMMEIGKWVGEGLAKGITGTTKKVSAATKKLADEAIKNLKIKFDTMKINPTSYIKSLQKVAKQYKLTSTQARTVQKEIHRASNVIASAVTKINKETEKANTNLLTKIQKINSQLQKDINKLKSDFQKQVADTARSIYNQVKLFEKVTVKQVSGETLLQNLKEQNKVFKEWQKNINKIAKSGAPKAFVDELRSMGVDYAGEIAAIANMTKEQLDEYVKAWKEKHTLAKQEANIQLADQKKKMEQQIKELTKTANAEINKAKREWQNNLSKLATEVSKLGSFKNSGKVLGKNTVNGIISGLKSMSGPLKEQARQLAKSIEKEIKKVLKIKSPSRLMLQIGVWIGEGLQRGIASMIDAIEKESQLLAKSAIFGPQSQFTGLNRIQGLSANSLLRNVLPHNIATTTASSIINNNQKTFAPQITNYFTPAESTPSEVMKKEKQMLQRLAMEWR